MPIRAIVDNTYYIFDSLGTALSWPAGARIQQIRLLTLNTTASAEFQVVAGTPWFSWSYVTHGTFGAGGTGGSVVAAHHVIPMGGVRVPAAIIPTTLTACTAWIDFA